MLGHVCDSVGVPGGRRDAGCERASPLPAARRRRTLPARARRSAARAPPCRSRGRTRASGVASLRSRAGRAPDPSPASSSPRTTRRRSFGWTAAAASGSTWASMRVRPLGALAVVELLPALARSGLRSRRQPQIGQRGAQVEAGTADDDRSAAGGENLVDRGVRQLLVLTDGSLVVERPDADEPPGDWFGENREPASRPASSRPRRSPPEFARSEPAQRRSCPEPVGPKIARTTQVCAVTRGGPRASARSSSVTPASRR